MVKSLQEFLTITKKQHKHSGRFVTIMDISTKKSTKQSTVLGVSLRTGFRGLFARHDSHYAGLGSIIYLLILLAVVGPNAATIINYGWYAFVIAGAALCLNLIGYLVGVASRLLTNDRRDVITYLFTVSKKEFSIAAAFVAASGLPSEIAIPSAFFAVVQMITSPIAAKIIARNQAPP